MTRNNLGIAYANLPTGDRGENVKKAIGCSEAAIRGYEAAGLAEEAEEVRRELDSLKGEGGRMCRVERGFCRVEGGEYTQRAVFRAGTGVNRLSTRPLYLGIDGQSLVAAFVGHDNEEVYPRR